MINTNGNISPVSRTEADYYILSQDFPNKLSTSRKAIVSVKDTDHGRVRLIEVEILQIIGQFPACAHKPTFFPRNRNPLTFATEVSIERIDNDGTDKTLGENPQTKGNSLA